jgi:hypothetical protein
MTLLFTSSLHDMLHREHIGKIAGIVNLFPQHGDKPDLSNITFNVASNVAVVRERQ